MLTMTNINFPVMEMNLIDMEVFHLVHGVGKNVLIFRVDMSSSTIIDSRKNDIFILRKVPTQDLEHKLCAEKCI